MSWTTLLARLRQRRASPQLGLLRGTDRGRFRVIATDGVHTAVVASEAFTLPPRAPRVALLRPADGARFPLGEVLSLHAEAYDPEDGPLAGEALRWVSDAVTTRSRAIAAPRCHP